MANYTINLLHKIDTFKLESESKSNGFMFRYNGNNYIVSVHHFLPITKTTLDTTSETVELNKIKNINWNELTIYSCPDSKFLLNTKVIKKYKTRFPEKKSVIKIEINNKFERYECVDYHIGCVNPLSKLRSIYIKFFIGTINESERLYLVNKYQGLSGKPVFDKDEKLIGVFCKTAFESTTEITSEGTKINVYGFILPTIYLTKSLNKKDNESIYYLDIHDFNSKLGKYEIQKDEKSSFVIYNLQCNYKLPLDIYVNMEGDEDSKITSKNINNLTFKTLKFIKNERFDFSLSLIKNELGEYKLNTGFISTLLKSGYKQQAVNTITKYNNCNETLTKIFIKISESSSK